MIKRILFLIFSGIVGYSCYYYFNRKVIKFDIRKFDTEVITRGDIQKVVTASGTINPVNVVDVGSQVSGTIEKIYVDFNDDVKKGQRLAVLDTKSLGKSVKELEASLKKAKSNLDLVELNMKRTKELYKNKYIAKIELDRAENELLNAKEDYNIVKLRYDKAKIELGYAYINSPVNGVVISRAVDEGQTVASSFSTPTLFRIAEDMSKMQIETSISESDIGMIKIGLPITFTVDAYKNKTFNGIISQVRLNPALSDNVVVYNVIIEIDNKDNLLLPGMTAYVSITINSEKDILRIPNTVFRFKVTKEARMAMGLGEMSDEEKNKLREKFGSDEYAFVYVLKNNTPIITVVKKGISDITYTKIESSEINEGDKVISSYLYSTKNKNK